MANILRVAAKEFEGFFSSLTAYIFLGAFVVTSLFIFFWVETFFARNVADVRPLFEWLPLLLVFLVPALTMRMWSEERRSGTIELLLTAPVSNAEMVLGKFTACMGLVSVALALTLPLPLTVGLFLGDIDWGPVIGGYVAALCLAAAYVSVGLYVSSRTDNQIVSLLVSVLVCGAFMLIGSDGFTGLFNRDIGETLRLIGAGSRFQSITRGVIDFRDLYYYVSIASSMLFLNVLGLEQLRWAGNAANQRHKTWSVISALCIANLIAGNFWLQQVGWARVDLTEGQLYSISPATRRYLRQLKEPLLIRCYFSKKTHPLLQPLVPRLKDLLTEYALASYGKVRVEFVDPLEKPEIEREAAEQYGIKPVVFQTASKYQAALTNSYFDILVKYGDQFEKLGWKDLVEVKVRDEQNLSVDLRNPEYDVTSAIKKVLYSYQGAGNLFLGIDRPVHFTAYVSQDHRLPPELRKLKRLLEKELEKLKSQSQGKLKVEFVDPGAEGGAVARKLESTYGFRPMVLGLLDPRTFWFYMVATCGDQLVQVPLPEQLDAGSLSRSINSALKRFSKGFLKTIGLCASGQAEMGMGGDTLSILRQALSDTYNVESVSLDSGFVPPDIDLLLLVAPRRLGDKQRFAVDQFLMKGGSVILAASPFDVAVSRTIFCQPVESGLEGWLKNAGIEMEKTMVLDPQSFPLPIPTRRFIGSVVVEETQLAPYPYFLDIRPSTGDSGRQITAGLDQVLMTWASPVKLDKERNKARRVMELLHSSPQAWTSPGTNIEPQYSQQQPLGFPAGKDRGKRLVAVAVEGSFESFFKGKKPPLLMDKASSAGDGTGQDKTTEKRTASNLTQDGATTPVAVNVIDKSPESAKVIVFASGSFLSDKMLWLASESIGSQYTKPIELVQNAIDWSLEDRELLSLRGRGHFARTLRATAPEVAIFFEYLNYGLALAGLGLVWLLQRNLARRQRLRLEQALQLILEQGRKQEVKA